MVTRVFLLPTNSCMREERARMTKECNPQKCHLATLLTQKEIHADIGSRAVLVLQKRGNI